MKSGVKLSSKGKGRLKKKLRAVLVSVMSKMWCGGNTKDMKG